MVEEIRQDGRVILSSEDGFSVHFSAFAADPGGKEAFRICFRRFPGQAAKGGGGSVLLPAAASPAGAGTAVPVDGHVAEFPGPAVNA